MTRITITHDRICVELSRLEQFAGMTRGVDVPRSAVTDVEVVDEPRRALRGLRVGTAIPWGTKLGRWYRRGEKDFVAFGAGERALVITLDGQPWRRLVLGCDDADSVARTLRRSS